MLIVGFSKVNQAPGGNRGLVLPCQNINIINLDFKDDSGY